MKPSTGQSSDGNMPVNHREKNHNSATTSRGVMSANKTSKHGMRRSVLEVS
jgi:hypothetical protein